MPPREADPTALLHFIVGKIYELKGNYHAAIIEMQEAAAIDSTYPTIHLAMAYNYLYLDKTENAIKSARKAIDIDEHFAEGYRLLVSLYERTAQTKQVALTLEHLIALVPEDIDSYFLLADAYITLEEDGRAIRTLKKLEKMGRLSPKTQIRMAAFYGTLGRDKEAKRLYRKGVEGDPSHVLAWLGLGMILESEGRRDEVIEMYEQALESNPESMDLFLRLARLYESEEQALKSEDPGFLLFLGQALIQVDRHDWANHAFEKALFFGREDASIWLDVAYAYSVDMDSLEAAIKTLERAIQVIPDEGDLYLALGEAYEEARQWDEAMASFQKALMFDPESTEYLFGLASFLEQSGRFNEAVATFEKLLALDSSDALALNYLGYMLADKGIRLEDARSLIERALAFEPDNGAFLDSMGWVLFRLGEYEEAEKYLDRAVQFERIMGDEENAVIFDHVGDVAEALGKLEKARASWAKSLEFNEDNLDVRQKLERAARNQ